MAKIRLSRKAIADLDGIWDYTVETWSEEQAVMYYRRIYTAIQGLNSLPIFLEKGYDVICFFEEGRNTVQALDSGVNLSIIDDRLFFRPSFYCIVPNAVQIGNGLSG